jgi:rhamnogalacturonyl hydrolase YesR
MVPHSSAADGDFGPEELDQPKPEPGLQKTQRRDWWPRMVMLKVLMQYYSATQDARVIDLMRRYFRYQWTDCPKPRSITGPSGRTAAAAIT